MDYLQKMLASARQDLLQASANLAKARKERLAPPLIRMAERFVLKTLDRAWEVQCMCGGNNVQV